MSLDWAAAQSAQFSGTPSLSERSFFSSLEDSLFSSASGDVLAARAAAIDLLALSGSADDPLATLILTALLVQAILEHGGDLRRSDIHPLCEAFLAPTGPAPRLSRSSSQFVRYAAEEVRRCEPDCRGRLLGRLAGALSGEETDVARDYRAGGSIGAISQKCDLMP